MEFLKDVKGKGRNDTVMRCRKIQKFDPESK